MAEDDRTAQGPVDDGGAGAGSGGAEQRANAWVRNRILLWAAFVGIAVLFSAWRVYQFADLEPRTDQAFTTAWARSLIHAERLFPQELEGAGFVERLTTDEGSLLNILLRQVALANDLIFTVVGLAWFTVLTYPFGGSMSAQIVASVVAGGLTLLVAASPPAARALSPKAWTGLAIVVAVHGAACFSHYTNVFILPPATVLLLLTDRARPLAQRLRVAVFYAVGIVLFLSPAVFPAVISPGASHDGAAQDFMTRLIWVFSQEGNTPLDWLERAGRWFSVMALTTSLPALVLGVAGLAAIARYQGLRLPLIVVSVHFLLGVVMSGFNQYDRTGAYALPFVFLDLAWSAVWCWEVRRRGINGWFWRPAVVVAIGTVLTFHMAAQVPALVDPEKVPLWATYVRRSAGFGRVVRDVEQVIPAGGVLIAWDYPLVHRFRALSQRAWTDYRIVRPAESLAREARAGRLREYARRFRIDIPENKPVYVFAEVERFDEELKREFLSVFGESGFRWSRTPAFRDVKRMEWRSRERKLTDFLLYEIR